MASGSSGSGRGGNANANAKGFDFGSDDILCSYDDYSAQTDSSNGTVPTLSKDFHKSRIARLSVFPAAAYNQPDDSFTEEVLVTVERSMKKYADNLMRFLEGISSRMSQLELYCYNLDKSIGEMRSDLVRDHGEADTKLNSLEKHLQEVHRSVQILRDKQELADTQKELAKLQLAQESAASGHSQSNEQKATPPAADLKEIDSTSEAANRQLALALPRQVMPQQPLASVPPPSQAQTQTGTQQQSYYLPPGQLPASSTQTQHPQPQYLPSDPQYRASQMQDVSRIPPQPVQTQVNQTPPGEQYPQYQQHWLPQLPQQVTPSQQPSIQPQIRPPSTAVYSTFKPPVQPPMQTAEPLPNSMRMQVSYSAVAQPLPCHANGPSYGCGTSRPMAQQPSPQQNKTGFGPQPADGYAVAGTPLPPAAAYLIYDGEGGRHNTPQYPQSGCHPTNVPLQNPPLVAPSDILYIANHPQSELIEKLLSMGFRVDHVVGVIQRMEESGQPVDFNAVLDRLNVHSSGGSQQVW